MHSWKECVLFFFPLLLWLCTQQSRAQIPFVSAETSSSSAFPSVPESASFIENKGQWPSNVRYLAGLDGMNAWITDHGIVYDFYQTVPGNGLSAMEASGVQRQSLPQGTSMPESTGRIGHVVTMEFAGASGRAVPVPETRRQEYHNYLIGSDRSKWGRNAALYGTVRLQELYPGISAVMRFDGGSLRYDLHVEAGKDPAAIRMKINGAGEVVVNGKGELVLRTNLGEVMHGSIFAYQEIGGTQKKVECGFRTEKNGELAFNVGTYDRRYPLVIDPLVYATFLSGSSYGLGGSLAVDDDGNVYVTGRAMVGDYPTTPGAYDTAFNSGSTTDIVVTKLNETGTRAIYSTYIGGSYSEGGSAITIDAARNAYVIGWTQAGSGRNDFPVTSGAYDTVPPGTAWPSAGNDVVVCKLNPDGTDLLYATYLGGLYNESGTGIAVDNDGNAYLTGQTSSRDFPVTSNAFKRTVSEVAGDFVGEAFVTKLSADGSSLVYSTYLGGERYDWAEDIAIDSDGNAYVTGQTNSWEFPTTPGAYDNLFDEGADWQNYDVFVTKLDNTGSKLVYSTFIGQTENDRGKGIVVDAEGNAYVTGTTSVTVITQSASFPVTPGSFDERFSGKSDGFVLKLNPSGSALLYSTLLGGDLDENFSKIALYEGNNAVVVGTTTSENYRTTSTALDKSYSADNQSDVVVSVLNETGSALLYSTYLGAKGQDLAADVAVGVSGDVYVGGATYAPEFPYTPGAYDSLPPSSQANRPKMFVARFQLSCGMTVRLGADLSVCAGSSVQLNTEVRNGVTPYSYSWSPARGLNKINVPNPIATPTETTQYVVTVTDGGGCIVRDTIRIVVPDPPGAFAGTDTTVCSGGTALLGAEATGASSSLTYAWSPPIGLNDPTIPRPTARPEITQIYILTVTDAMGCTSRDTVQVTVRKPITVALSADAEICPGEGLGIRAGVTGGAGDYRYQWEPAEGLSQVDVADPIASPLVTTAYRVMVTDSAGCSVVSDPITITVRPRPAPTIVSSGPLTTCVGEIVTLDAGQGYTSYLWSTGERTQTIDVADAGAYSVEVIDVDGCVGWSDTVELRLLPRPDAVIGGPLSVCSDGIGVYSVRAGADLSYEWRLESDWGTIESGTGSNKITVRWGGAETAIVHVIVRDGVTGCADSTAYEVSVGSGLKPVIRGPEGTPVLCAGEQMELDAGEGYTSYLWSTGERTRTIIVDQTMDVYVTVEDAEGCAGTSDIYGVTVKAAPVVRLSHNGTLRLCPGTEQVLAVSSSYSDYQWSTGEATPSIVVDAPGEYWVHVVDPDGCFGWSDTLHVLPTEATPLVTSDGDRNLCAGESVRLSASPGYAAYEWSTGETTASIVVSTAGNYRVTVTGVGGCESSSAAMRVTVSPRPAIPSIVRTGDTLWSDVADAYQWIRDGVEIPGGTGQQYIVDKGGSYTVRVFNVAGCFAESEEMDVQRNRVVWLDTTGGEVGTRLWLTMFIDPPLSAAEEVTGYEAWVRLEPNALFPHRATAGDDGITGDALRMNYDGNGSVMVTPLSVGSRIEGSSLFHLELEGLVTGQPLNSVKIDSVVLEGLGTIPIMAHGVVTLTGCEVDRRFSKSARIFSVVPNPGDEEVTITYRAPEGLQMNLRVLDPLGRVMKVRPLNAGSGDAELVRLGLDGLPTGLYLLELRDREEVVAVPLLVR